MKTTLFFAISIILCTGSILFSLGFGLEEKTKPQQINSNDFFLADYYSSAGFVRFSPATVSGVRVSSGTTYTSSDARYKDWTIIYYPNNRDADQWQIKPPAGVRAPICITVRCCDGNNLCYTVSCRSVCTKDECCAKFTEWWNKQNR